SRFRSLTTRRRSGTRRLSSNQVIGRSEGDVVGEGVALGPVDTCLAKPLEVVGRLDPLGDEEDTVAMTPVGETGDVLHGVRPVDGVDLDEVQVVLAFHDVGEGFVVERLPVEADTHAGVTHRVDLAGDVAAVEGVGGYVEHATAR